MKLRVSLSVTDARLRRDNADDRLGSLFSNLPGDMGHLSASLCQHSLDPLRHSPPEYGLEALEGNVDGDYLASNLPNNIASVVVVRLSEGS
jgi:hypothetical protein